MRQRATLRCRLSSSSPEAVTRFSPSISKAPKSATGSTPAGVTCVLVKYRVPNTGPYPKSPAALQDAQRALGIVRRHAAEWHIDPSRVGVLGFSAGAHLAAALSTHFDKRLYDSVDAADQLGCRPDFAFIIYPGYLANAAEHMAPNADINPTAQTPPTFIVQAENDPVNVENATVYFLQLKAVKVPAELHIYAEGGHGYGLRRTELPVTSGRIPRRSG